LAGDACLFDISRRRVMALHPGPNDVSRLVPGLYFVRQAAGGESSMARKVVLTTWAAR